MVKALSKKIQDEKLRIRLETRVGGIVELQKLVEAHVSGSFAPDKQHVIEKCQNEISTIFETINKDQAEYDKQLLTLSSGILALSLAFIKDIVPLQEAKLLWLLYGSYGLLTACILLVLFSYQFSIAGQLKAKEFWEEKEEGNDPSFPFGHANCVKWMNRICGFLFGTGISLLISFAILNIHSEVRAMNNRSGVGDGAYIKSPAKKEDRGSLIKSPAKPANNQSNSSGNSEQPKNK